MSRRVDDAPGTEAGRRLVADEPEDIWLLRDVLAIEADAYRDGFSDGRQSGLVEAMRRLSVAGLHRDDCPEPSESCACGIDAAIQQPPSGLAPVALAGFDASAWGRFDAENRAEDPA